MLKNFLPVLSSTSSALSSLLDYSNRYINIHKPSGKSNLHGVHISLYWLSMSLLPITWNIFEQILYCLYLILISGSLFNCSGLILTQLKETSLVQIANDLQVARSNRNMHILISFSAAIWYSWLLFPSWNFLLLASVASYSPAFQWENFSDVPSHFLFWLFFHPNSKCWWDWGPLPGHFLFSICL